MPLSNIQVTRIHLQWLTSNKNIIDPDQDQIYMKKKRRAKALFGLCMQPLVYVQFYLWENIYSIFLSCIQACSRRRALSKQAGTIKLCQLTNSELTSLILKLFDPGYPSVPPIMVWVYCTSKLGIKVIEMRDLSMKTNEEKSRCLHMLTSESPQAKKVYRYIKY